MRGHVSRRAGARLFGSILVGAALTAPAPDARAEESDKVNFGVGLIGSLGGNFLDKPERGNNPDLYPGFGGLTAGGGLLFDLRFVDLVGVEVDVIRSSDKGNGTVTASGVKFDLTIGQSAWHVPVLAKVTLPTPLIALAFFVGPEFVFPSDPSIEIDPDPLIQIAAEAESYTMVTAGVGLEVKLPLPVIDLRIPVTLRGSYNPGVSDEFEDRLDLTTNTYNSEWKYVFALTAGAGIYF